MQAEQRGDDAGGGDLGLGGTAAALERLLDERAGQRRHGAGDEAVAEIAVVAHRARGATDDARIGDVDGIGHDRRGRVGA